MAYRFARRLVTAPLLLTVLFLAACDPVVAPDVEPPVAVQAFDAEAVALIGPDAPAVPMQAGCTTGVQPSGATYIVCQPAAWNGSALLYAHGYQRPQGPPSISDETYVLADLVTDQGFVFAASSYRKSGLAILEGLDDMVDLADIVEDQLGGVPGKVFLTGASEGGAVTTLGVERHPAVFDGGLTTCGPCGNFEAQLNYFGDFRTVFDYFFPGRIPGTPVNVPPDVVEDWDAVYKPAVLAAIAAHPGATEQLLRVTRAPVDPADPASVRDVVTTLLEYNIFATNEAQASLGGNPYDNSRRWYSGSNNDWRLNWRIARYRADAAARDAVRRYETSGRLDRPLVSLHTTGDAEVPVWQQLLYRWKAYLNGSFAQFSGIPINRFGHCTFTNDELIAGLGLLILKSGAQPAASVHAALPATAQPAFERLHTDEVRVRATPPRRPEIALDQTADIDQMRR